MRWLGIDYGQKHVGLALSDTEGRLAFPERVLSGPPAEAIREIIKIVRGQDIAIIVIGLPLGFDGKETEESAAVRAFADKLKAGVRIPIYFENEILTTRMAEAAGGRSELSDASAAAIILQSYLDKKTD